MLLLNLYLYLLFPTILPERLCTLPTKAIGNPHSYSSDISTGAVLCTFILDKPDNYETRDYTKAWYWSMSSRRHKHDS